MIDDVDINPAVTMDVPANVASATPPAGPPMVQMEELAPGVFYVNAAGIRSWAVEFRDHITVVEGPASEARSLAVNEAITQRFPNKPIRYVINTHAHYDHAGGLRTYVAQGATVVTHEANRAFYERTWARPHTIQQDLLAKEPKQATFETMTDKKVMTDGQQTLELYHVRGSGHHTGMIFIYSPRARAVYWGDGYNPPEGDDPRDPARTPEFGIDLYRNIVASGVNVERIAPAHGAGVKPFDNLRKAIGLMAVTQ
jgi:glyoxylase-like metal-dependent hydrolase (beta-lactamase superfamily II)